MEGFINGRMECDTFPCVSPWFFGSEAQLRESHDWEGPLCKCQQYALLICWIWAAPSLRVWEICIFKVLFRKYFSKFLNNALHCWNTKRMSVVTLRSTEIPGHLAGPAGSSLEVSFECQVWLLNLWHLQTLTHDKLQYFLN